MTYAPVNFNAAGQFLIAQINAGFDIITSGTVYAGAEGVSASNSSALNTTSMNAIIAGINAAGGDTTIVLPAGTIQVGALTTITTSNVWFLGAGGPGTSVLKGTASSMLQWGDASHVVVRGGAIGVGFDGNHDVGQVLILLANAYRMDFPDSVHGINVGNFMTLGTGSLQVAQIHIDRMRSPMGIADLAVPFINCVNGAGVSIDDPDIFTVATAGTSVSGRYFLNFSDQSWDTVSIVGGIIQTFDSPLVVNAGDSIVLQNFNISGVWFDGMSRGLIFIAAANGIIVSVQLTNNEITAETTGPGIVIEGAGFNWKYIITNNIIRGCAGHGIDVPSTAILDGWDISHNQIYGINQANGGFNGINIEGTNSNGKLSHNTVDFNVNIFGGNPQYGIKIDQGDHLTIVGNTSTGITAAWNIESTSAFTNSYIDANPDLPSTTAALSVGASPYTVPANARPQTVSIGNDGTGVAIALNGVALTNVPAPVCLTVPPQGVLIVTYTTKPTIFQTLN